jgi:hypothetical protein
VVRAAHREVVRGVEGVGNELESVYLHDLTEEIDQKEVEDMWHAQREMCRSFAHLVQLELSAKMASFAYHLVMTPMPNGAEISGSLAVFALATPLKQVL